MNGFGRQREKRGEHVQRKRVKKGEHTKEFNELYNNERWLVVRSEREAACISSPFKEILDDLRRKMARDGTAGLHSSELCLEAGGIHYTR
jgi:hypothetical protein